MKVFVVDIESASTRYTGEWKTHVPNMLRDKGYNDIYVISGEDTEVRTTPGAFLNFSATNIYKAQQVEAISQLFMKGKVTAQDQFLFTDAWHPGILNLKYMSELLGIPVITHGLWHAGNYDPQDFLGRIVGNKAWISYAEKSFFHAYDHNYFATQFHIDMFCKNLLDSTWDSLKIQYGSKIVRTGWPMEYLEKLFESYDKTDKQELILFPHRIAPEKQVEIFRDLKNQLPQYKFIVCQEKQLTKEEYHKLLCQSKIVFSANLQETLGISCYEALLADSIPVVPDRLSYAEMYDSEFKYPSLWTQNFDSYKVHRTKLCEYIENKMETYESHFKQQVKYPEVAENELVYNPLDFSITNLVTHQRDKLTNNFFSANNLFPK